MKRLGLLAREPAVMIGPVTALLTLAVVFGWLKPDKSDAIKGMLIALGPLLATFAMRARSNSAETVASVAVQALRRADAVNSGPPGEVTAEGARIAQDVVGKALGNAELAERAVASVLPIAGAADKGG